MNNEILKRILSSLILIPIALFFIIKGSYFFIFFILICFLISSYEWHFMSKNKKYYLPGFIFIIFSFYTFYFFRIEGEYRVFLLIFIVCIATDIGGYIFGKIFKWKKLSKISPKKTISGVFGSYFCSIISFVILNNFYSVGRDEFIWAIIFSTVAQTGDLTISYFKRLEKIKDTGKILPGHGGIFDRIDGLMFVVIVAFFVQILFINI